MRITTLLAFLTVSLVGAAGSALADTPPAAAQAAAAQAATADQTYVLGPADVVEVEVLGHADFKARARIDQDGTHPRFACPFAQLPQNRGTHCMGERVKRFGPVQRDVAKSTFAGEENIVSIHGLGRCGDAGR